MTSHSFSKRAPLTADGDTTIDPTWPPSTKKFAQGLRAWVVNEVRKVEKAGKWDMEIARELGEALDKQLVRRACLPARRHTNRSFVCE